MLTYVSDKAKSYFAQLRLIDLLSFNKFIFRNLILHVFKTENILPFLIATCVIGFSILTQASRFVFIPQTSVVAFASFFIFTLVVSIITLIIYPIFIILIVNFLISYIKGVSWTKLTLKITILMVANVGGVVLFSDQSVPIHEKALITAIWLGLYFILTGLYLTHLKHNTLVKISKTKIAFIMIIGLAMTRPLVMIYLHTLEALNFTNINPQVYLPASNCALLKDLDGNNRVSPDNNIFFNKEYYQELPDNGGCYIYANTIRYSFAYDFVLLVKKNILPIRGKNGSKYNEYVRLCCYAGNCYSENHLFFKDNNDIYNELIRKGGRLDKPL